MTPEDRRNAAELDRYWDGYALIGRPSEEDELDRETAALVDQLWEVSEPPTPGAVRERVWKRLQEQRGAMEGAMDSGVFEITTGRASTVLFPSNGRVAPLPLPKRRPTWWQRMPGQLATAALLLLVVGVGLFAAGPLRPAGKPTPSEDMPAVIMAPATPTPSETKETLLAIPVSHEMLPQGERVTAHLAHVTSPPGSTGSWTAEHAADWPGLRAQYVLEGNLAVRAEGDAQVVRAETGAPEHVAAGKEVLLGPGDAWIARNEVPFEAVNTSEAPAELLLWVLANIEDEGVLYLHPVPGAWDDHHDAPFPPGVNVPEGPAILRIRRLALPVEGRLPELPTGLQYGVTLRTDAEGTPIVGPSVGTLPNGRIVNIGNKAATVYVLTLEPGAVDMGTLPAGTVEP